MQHCEVVNSGRGQSDGLVRRKPGRETVPQTPNTRLKILLEETSWSQAQLASAVRAIGAEHGQPLACHQSTVSRWLSGTAPRPPEAAVLVEALSRRLGRPVSEVSP
ncbi:helix-turn-helix domain-containing protein [Streptomyces sp. NPDC051555]|uniref:helix-turn-helix domain-containing protein n=1 Tax=Streptomyces sp. NPDC051555 TaxID=3365657 RepID=UPI0037A1942B